LFRFEIPKEIKTQVRLLGLELKEWAVIGIVIVFSLTVFSDMIHKVFVVPFYIVIAFSIVYLFSPSSANPQRKNYHSLFYFIKRVRGGYLSVNSNDKKNQALREVVLQNNSRREENPDVGVSEITHTNAFSEVEFRDGAYHFVERNIDEVENKLESESVVNKVESIELDKERDVSVERYENDRAVDSNNYVGDVSLEKEDKQNRFPDGEKESTRKDDLQIQKEGGENREMQFSSGFAKGMAIVVALFIVVGGLFLFIRSDSEFLAKEDDLVVDDEVLVSALRSFSLKDYDEAMLLFDEIDYEALEDDDKDVMLLTYLFGDNPEVALELEPDFDEVVASYYKASHSMQKIRDLGAIIDSNVLDFEIAVSDRDYEKIIELKDFVKIKDERGEKIVEAFIETKQLDEAKEFIEELDDEELKTTLMLKVKEFEDKEKEKKNAEKTKGKGDK